MARMAGMPKKVLERATKMLKVLEESHSKEELERKIETSRNEMEGVQLSFVQLDDPIIEQIKEDILNIDINTLTPVEALMKLNEIKSLLEGKKK